MSFTAVPPMLRLPREILDEILTEVESHTDLISLALASQACADLVIPRHSQYRILRIRQRLPEVWAHLARRADLARNIREVHLCERQNYAGTDHYPTVLVPTNTLLSASGGYDEEHVRARNMWQALKNMSKLRVFTWSASMEYTMPTLLPIHEEMILATLVDKSTLKHVGLSGPFGLRSVSLDASLRVHYPAWRFSNLKSLSLHGDVWVKRGNAILYKAMLKQSPCLEYLELPMEVTTLASSRLPALKQFKLFVQSGCQQKVDQAWVDFLDRHPTIEELSWFPIGPITLKPTTLPALKKLESNRHFLIALEEAFGSGQSEEGSEESKVEEVVPDGETETDVSAETLPEPPVFPPLERLDLLLVGESDLLFSLKAPNYANLRTLKIVNPLPIDDLTYVHKLAEMFPSLRDLSLPGTDHNLNGDWVDALARFPELEIFRGAALWAAVGRDKNQLHSTIMELVHHCPRLRQLDHCDYYSKRRDWKKIVVIRTGEEVLYDVQRPVQRPTFDVIDGIFT